MRRIFVGIFALSLLGIFVPGSSQAFDQRCFTKEQCLNKRGDIILDNTTKTDGFYTGSDAWDACGVTQNKGKNATGEEVGFCLPVSQAETKISFGGKQSFANFGDFIQYIYKYGMWLAGITAVGLIIISGFQWAASGGNSDMIGSAKNRISGAVTGLILLSLAYTILNTINPYLVQLRLPQTWMINEIGLAPPQCNQVKDKNLALIGPGSPAPTDTQLELALTQAKNSGYTVTPTAATCGNEYLVDGAGKLSCSGTVCAPSGNGIPKACLPFDVPIKNTDPIVISSEEIKRANTCWQGNLVIRYSVAGLFSGLINTGTKNLAGSVEESDDDYWLQDDTTDSKQEKTVEIALVCKTENSLKFGTKKIKTGNLVPFTILTNPNGYDQYIIQYAETNRGLDKILAPAISNPGEFCKKSSDQIVGIFILNEVNVNWDTDDEIMYVGLNESKSGASGYVRKGEGTYFTPLSETESWIENYIPIEKITNPNESMFLEFVLTETLLNQFDKS